MFDEDNFIHSRKVYSWKRMERQIWFVGDVAPVKKGKRSKTSNIQFQQQLQQFLKETKRRAFKSKVVLSINFKLLKGKEYPAIHNLVKNYLDLIQQPLSEIKSNRKALLLEDDSQIEYLFAGYFRGQDEGVSIQVIPLRGFLQDLAIYQNYHDQYEDEMDSNPAGDPRP